MYSKTLLAAATIALAVAFAAPRQMRSQMPGSSGPSNDSAQPSSANTTPQDATTNLSQAATEAAQMVPAQAQLTQNLDSKSLQPGEQFKATLQGKVHLKNGVELPRGTTLVGTVASESAPLGAKSDLALRFTQADLKNGQTIPIQATIVAVSPPQTENTATAEMLYNAPPDPWDGKTLVFDEPSALSNIELHSKIAGQDSGHFTSAKKSDLKLGARTQISLAIGPQGTTQPNGGY